MELNKLLFSILVGIIFNISLGLAIPPTIKLDGKGRGITSLIFEQSNEGRNYLNRNDYLGDLYIKYDGYVDSAIDNYLCNRGDDRIIISKS